MVDRVKGNRGWSGRSRDRRAHFGQTANLAPTVLNADKLITACYSLPNSIGEMCDKRDSSCHFSQIKSIRHISCTAMAKLCVFLMMCLLSLQTLAATTMPACQHQSSRQILQASVSHCGSATAAHHQKQEHCADNAQQLQPCDNCHSCQLCASPMASLKAMQTSAVPYQAVLALAPASSFSSQSRAPLHHPPRPTA